MRSPMVSRPPSQSGDRGSRGDHPSADGGGHRTGRRVRELGLHEEDADPVGPGPSDELGQMAGRRGLALELDGHLLETEAVGEVAEGGVMHVEALSPEGGEEDREAGLQALGPLAEVPRPGIDGLCPAGKERVQGLGHGFGQGGDVARIEPDVGIRPRVLAGAVPVVVVVDGAGHAAPGQLRPHVAHGELGMEARDLLDHAPFEDRSEVEEEAGPGEGGHLAGARLVAVGALSRRDEDGNGHVGAAQGFHELGEGRDADEDRHGGGGDGARRGEEDEGDHGRGEGAGAQGRASFRRAQTRWRSWQSAHSVKEWWRAKSCQ